MRESRPFQILMIAVFFLCQSPGAEGITAAELKGVWLTVDASDAEGRSQGGIVFRADGSGEFLEASFEAGAPDILKRLIDIPDTGTANIAFVYKLEGTDVVELKITHFRGIPVVEAKPQKWKVTLADQRLELKAVDHSGKWIAFRKV